jgi:deoxycytidylate deaminase
MLGKAYMAAPEETGLRDFAKADEEYRQVLHAEVLAIIRARGKLIHKIKIERYDSRGNPKDACPCPVCSIAIKEAKIKFIEYTMG